MCLCIERHGICLFLSTQQISTEINKGPPATRLEKLGYIWLVPLLPKSSSNDEIHEALKEPLEGDNIFLSCFKSVQMLAAGETKARIDTDEIPLTMRNSGVLEDGAPQMLFNYIIEGIWVLSVVSSAFDSGNQYRELRYLVFLAHVVGIPDINRFYSKTLNNAAKNFGLGAALSLARVLLPKISSPARAIASIQLKHFKMGLFFGFYIGIYRAVICYLCRKQGADSALYALPAGYLAGLSFLFSPSLGFATASVTAALKLYSTILYEKEVLTTKVPLPELLYCICQGTLFHARFLHPTTCPSYVFKLTDGVSYGRTVIVSGLLQEAVKMK